MNQVSYKVSYNNIPNILLTYAALIASPVNGSVMILAVCKTVLTSSFPFRINFAICDFVPKVSLYPIVMYPLPGYIQSMSNSFRGVYFSVVELQSLKLFGLSLSKRENRMVTARLKPGREFTYKNIPIQSMNLENFVVVFAYQLDQCTTSISIPI